MQGDALSRDPSYRTALSAVKASVKNSRYDAGQRPSSQAKFTDLTDPHVLFPPRLRSCLPAPCPWRRTRRHGREPRQDTPGQRQRGESTTSDAARTAPAASSGFEPVRNVWHGTLGDEVGHTQS